MLANDPVTQARIDLATALRAAVRHGLNEGVCNHFSMTVPGREELFLVNPQGLHWSEITPSDLVMADGDGQHRRGQVSGRADAPSSSMPASTTATRAPRSCCTPTCPMPRR